MIQPNYRGTLGYGRAYREALFGAWGQGDLDDNLGGIDLCAKRGLIRPDRVVAWGGSAGGYSTLVCLTGAPDRFAAGVALFGLYDLYTFGLETHRYERYYVETILGPSAETNRSGTSGRRSTRRSGPGAGAPAPGRTRPRRDARPVGDADPGAGTHRIDHYYAFYPDEGHGFRKVANNIDYAQRMIASFARKFCAHRTPVPMAPSPTRRCRSVTRGGKG